MELEGYARQQVTEIASWSTCAKFLNVRLKRFNKVTCHTVKCCTDISRTTVIYIDLYMYVALCTLCSCCSGSLSYKSSKSTNGTAEFRFKEKLCVFVWDGQLASDWLILTILRYEGKAGKGGGGNTDKTTCDCSGNISRNTPRNSSQHWTQQHNQKQT